MTQAEYMDFFERWLHKQFPSTDSDWDNYALLRTAGEIVKDSDDLKDWGNRSCWAMYDYAKTLNTQKEVQNG